ncbi:unnamed protein product [Prunus armeniaca]
MEELLLEGCNHDDPNVAEWICCAIFHLLKGYEEQEVLINCLEYEESKYIFGRLKHCFKLKKYRVYGSLGCSKYYL